MPPSPDEMIDIVDKQNQVVRRDSKHAAHRHGWLHRTVLAAVRDPDGNIVLVRQASDRQDPGQFVVPVGGHVKAGETSEQALLREAQEEIGLPGVEHIFLDQFIYDRKVIGRHENHLFIVFQIVADPAHFVLGPEAVEHRSFSVPELKMALKNTPEMFGGSYHVLLQHFAPRIL